MNLLSGSYLLPLHFNFISKKGIEPLRGVMLTTCSPLNFDESRATVARD